MARLLRALELTPAEVRDWPPSRPGPIPVRGFEGLSDLPLFASAERESGDTIARRIRLVAEALRPAATTDAWRDLPAAPRRRARRAHPLRLRQPAGRGGDDRTAAAPQAGNAGRDRRSRHSRSRARPPGRRRAAPLGHRHRRFGRCAAEPHAARRLSAPGARPRRQPTGAGAAAGRAEAPAGRRRARPESHFAISPAGSNQRSEDRVRRPALPG